MKKVRKVFTSINFKIAMIFMLLLLATIEIVGAYFTRQLEQTSIQSFETSIQIPNTISNQISAQLSRSNIHKANQQLNRIISNYNNNDAISSISIIDSKGVIRAVSNLNDQNRVGQRATNADVKEVLSSGKQVSKVINDDGNYMMQITPLTASNGTNTTIGAISVRASMQGVFNTIRNVSLVFLTASLVAAFLGAIVALIISRAITRPIEEMRKQALRVSDGDYSGHVKVYADDELGQLARAFNTLSVRIERTQEVSDSERRRLDNVLTHMTDGVIATDRHGNITIINETALDFLGKTEKEVIGEPITKLLGLKDVTIQDLMSSQQELMVTVNENTRDEMILHANFSLIQRVTGFVSGLVCVLHDITEQQKNEREQQQFVSNVSHELRTPLTSLRAYVEALNDGAWKDPNVAPQFLGVIQDETQRMIRMINDLLSLSRMDRGVAKMDLEWVNFNDFVSHVLNRFDMMIKTDEKNKKQSKKYSIKREFSGQDLWVEIDTDKMMQVIDNIMNNAIKYSPDGGVITVRLLQANKHIILSISDQGLGIPRKDLTKIFDRFYRVDKARSRKQGGTGLGLAISKEIVEAHHGRIWADSAEGEGSTFYISIPYEPMTEEGDSWDEV
ncbi:cell wall metabolism sensor histidine kinase WalK [Lactobacillus hominis]|uniref:histidine kinase n=1 Tax=Lactobacillus hominis DSM 23910 = CRBIP 24.179 TaxID=1423758 RepID=I7L5X9_9LACO|nr:cell wall metabolism sensor histidine kinase WalK [Lactobacillus hominis]KRM84918.1 two-component sensor kinase sa14-24 [Lactobacillus hominis DSM 23910 = CRBIP 24.179]MCT3348118.1 cell wall metabolism sensor histidine kinase WalK [Lactobacillus hominis]CCI81682.1 Histidine kinase [Lactobacillus hominis DSM 23910 = CRBIP 24.179]